MTKRLIAIILTVLVLAGCSAPAQESQPPEATQQTQPPQTVQETQNVQTLELPPFEMEAEVVLEKVGQTVQIYTSEDLTGVIWASEDETVATVADGIVTAVQRGETIVTALRGEESFSCRVICDLPVPMRLNEEAGERDPVYLPPDVELVDDSFFDDALFIGDSQGQIFYNCVKYAGLMGDATYLVRNSYSIEHAADNKMLLFYRGRDYVIEEAIAATEAKRVFFMLGVNDVAKHDISEMDLVMEKWENVLDRIQAMTPDVQICIQSLPMVWTGGESEKVTNENVREYNARLQQLAEEKGCVFIDIAPYFVDSTGGMATCYSQDKFVHVNAAGVDTWVKVLKACTDYE